MAALSHLPHRRERGFALVIVLAFVVLLTGLVVAYLSRTTSDRQVAHSSFHQSKVDQVAASGMDLIIGGLRQEITGPLPTPTPPYVPATNAGMLPLTFGNPDPTGIPNLVRRSVNGDTSAVPAPAVASFASTVNSTTDVSANGRSITLARWNKHYLVPKLNTGNDQTDPVATFVAPDWVILTRNGAVAFSAWNPSLADQTPTNNSYAVGRFAYAIYDEGQLLDMNVAGYPSPPSTTADQVGRKGPVAFADLTTLPYPIPNTQTDKLVGWRNYGSIQPPASFGPFPNFTFTAALATNYVNNFILLNTTGFTTVGTNTANGQTDQVFSSRQELIAFQKSTGFSANALQYLTTFSRELNAPSWKPSTPLGSSIDYATLANNPTPSTSTAINRDLLNVRVPGSATTKAFTRADGTDAFGTDILIKRRFPLSRINGLADPTFASTAISTINNGFRVPATAATVQRDFGLSWDNTNKRWNYVGASGSTVQSAIERLDQVAAENREPNFFELLKATILGGSIGMGSGSSGRTFVAAEPKYYSNAAPTSSDYQIIQIGANIIDQWDSDNVPTFINFGGNELAGTENLPYLNKLVFKPHWKGGPQFEAWLLPSLWNPHQNAPPATQNVRIAMASGTMTAVLTDSGTPSSITTTTPITGNASTQFMTVDASKFPTSSAAPTPSAPTAASIVKPPNPPSTITLSNDGFYGFYFPFATTAGVTSSNSLTAYPDFGAAGCDFQLQVQVSTSPAVWKAYQTWKGCGPLHPLVFQPPAASWTLATLQDPEFVALDPRTLRFGVSGNAANQPGASPSDFTSGVLTTMEVSAGTYEAITALPPKGTNFTYTGPPYALYNYANNPTSSTVYYTDLDTLRRQGDIISGTTTAMLPADSVDRPRILNPPFQRPFQSLAELGQVFRDQPWKTLDFTTASSPDVGLLDVLSLHESANEGGKTSINTRHKVILTAIL
jgi:hypothetical protein